jgi:hypothetical protein
VAVLFYKVTCPTCQIAAPAAQRLRRAFPGRFVAIGQDPPEKLDAFDRQFETDLGSVSDQPPYEVSDAYGIRTVPTVFVLDGGRVDTVVESWDRDGWNRAASRLGELTGEGPQTVSAEGDGLPPFRPG